MAAKLHTVNFGQVNASIPTVGYTILNVDGTERTARSQEGVVEYGTATGIYGANIDYDNNDQLVVLWDTGDTSPRYAVEESRSALNSIQEDTDQIRMIWNTLRNQGEVFQDISKALDKLAGIKNYDAEFQNIMDQIKKLVEREIVQLKDIKEALKITIKPPTVKIAKDKGATIEELNLLLEGLADVKESVKNSQPVNGMHVVNDNIKTIGNILQQLVKTMPSDDLLVALKENLKYLQQQKNEKRIDRLKDIMKV